MVALLWVFGESDDIVFRGSTPPILGTQRSGRWGDLCAVGYIRSTPPILGTQRWGRWGCFVRRGLLAAGHHCSSLRLRFRRRLMFDWRAAGCRRLVLASGRRTPLPCYGVWMPPLRSGVWMSPPRFGAWMPLPRFWRLDADLHGEGGN